MEESPGEYYKRMKQLASEKRQAFSISTSDIKLSRVRQIYKEEGILIDRWPYRLRKVKAAYFNDEYGCSVLLNMKLPEEPRLFAMLHELKHHYEDSNQLRCFCLEFNEDSSPLIEKGAEVFAAEFIFPEEEIREYVPPFIPHGKNITAEDVVHMKYNSPAIVSYQFLIKSLERLGFIRKGQFAKVQFHKLHAELYGSHHYHKRKQ